MFVFVRTKSDLLIYVILNVGGTICGDVWNYVKLLQSGIKPQLTFVGLKKHLSTLFILFSSSVAVSIYQVFDTLMLGFMADYQQVGFYNSATYISKAVISIVGSLSAVVLPKMSQYYKAKEIDRINDLVSKSFLLVSFIAFPAAVGLACLAPTFVPLFFGAKFSGTIIPLMILSLLIVIIGLNGIPCIQILVSLGYDRLFCYAVLMGGVSNFLLNLILIPAWGADGAAIASVCAETLVLGSSVWYVYHKTPVHLKVSWLNLFKSLFGALIFLPTILLLGQFLGGWMLVAVFILVGSGIYMFSQMILKNRSLDLFMPIILQKLRRQRIGI